MGFSDSPVLLKVALGLLLIALILDIVGVATPHWGEVTVDQYSSSLGLWKSCGSSEWDVTVCAEYPDVLVEDWLKACRAFGIIGILAMLATTVLEVLCTFVFSKVTHKMFFILTTIIAFGGAASVLLSVIIWGAKYSDAFSKAMSMLSTASYSLNWSFGLSIAGAILSAVGGASVAVVTFQN